MINDIIGQDRRDFAKCVTDDMGLPAWECLHFAREWVCVMGRREHNTEWGHWVREGYEASRGKAVDIPRLMKAVRQLRVLAGL